MIQPAAPSVASGLALTVGSQATKGDDAAVSGHFAALLQANRKPANDQKDTDPDAAGPVDAAQVRQAPGKTGKELPSALPGQDKVAGKGEPAAKHEVADKDKADDSAPATSTTAMTAALLPIALPLPTVPAIAAAQAKATADAGGSAAPATPGPTPKASASKAKAPAIAAQTVPAPRDPQDGKTAAKPVADPKAALAAKAQVPAPADGKAADMPVAADKGGPDDATAVATPPATIAADLKPAFAVSDQQALAPAASPTPAAPTTGNTQPVGHDFATLVDRLVEARDAAVPQAVHAAISHSEFGQVSLRFEHDAGGLSVAMSSADPDFARAVQAGAASAQPQTAGDNGSSAGRQDAPSQQQAQAGGSPSGQPQAQSQGYARNERAAPSRTAANVRPQTQDEAAAEARSGIYA